MSKYPAVGPMTDIPAPGATTDILEDDFTVPDQGYHLARIQIALAVAGKVKLIDKPGDDESLYAAAEGQIQAIAGADIVDDEAFVLNDGVNPAVTFKFDTNASVVESGTLRKITIDGSETAAEIAELIRAAIAAAPTLAITPSINADDDTKVDLVNDEPGTAGNQAITDTVVNAGFTHTGMSGGFGGETAVILDLNGASNLDAGVVFGKDYLLHSGRNYNLQLTVDGIVDELYVGVERR